VIPIQWENNYFGKQAPVHGNRCYERSSRNSIFTFEGVIPYSFLYEIGAADDRWGNNSILTFLLLEKGSNTEAVNKKLTDVVLEYIPQSTTKYVLFPLLDIHCMPSLVLK